MDSVALAFSAAGAILMGVYVAARVYIWRRDRAQRRPKTYTIPYWV